jgi:4'-phosphopantetheinyl transferase
MRLGNLSPLDEASARALLTEDELARADRYLKTEDRRNALQVRSALRILLSLSAREVGHSIAPEAWRFDYGPKGKPSLCAAQRFLCGLEFNLSHSGDWLLIGLVRLDEPGMAHELAFGVDIERARPKTDIDSIMRHYFSPMETRQLLALTIEEARRGRFFDLWALKESYIKATGLGLAQSLLAFGFDMNNLKENSLALDILAPRAAAGAGCLTVVASAAASRQLPWFDNIGLRIFGERNEPGAWQSFLGRLDEEYRFALSLGGSEMTGMTVNIRAFELEYGYLLDALS